MTTITTIISYPKPQTTKKSRKIRVRDLQEAPRVPKSTAQYDDILICPECLGAINVTCSICGNERQNMLAPHWNYREYQ